MLILAGISIATLTGENGVLTKANTAKEKTEIEEAKEQAKLDIAVWTADKLSNGESADLDDSIIKGILGEREYVREARQTSFITEKGKHEIPYSDLYQNNEPKKEEIQFTLEGVKLTAYKGETWYQWVTRNRDLIQNTTFGVDPETGVVHEENDSPTDEIIKFMFSVYLEEDGPMSIFDIENDVHMVIILASSKTLYQDKHIMELWVRFDAEILEEDYIVQA